MMNESEKNLRGILPRKEGLDMAKSNITPLLSLTAPGQKLIIGILGYQYPDDKDSYDAEWLILEISVEYAGQSWVKRDPALVARDLRLIQNWFKSLHDGRGVAAEPMGFWEQNLAFSSFGQLKSGAHEIGLHLAYGFLPPGSNQDRELILRFTVTNEQIQAIANSADHCALAFPSRFEGGA